MAFGYTYWMVFLPEIEPHSYLLFVHNPDGKNKLRNYVSGCEQVVGQPGVEVVFRDTQIAKTRHECDPHTTKDRHFWYQKTQELNRRYLGGTGSAAPCAALENERTGTSRTIGGVVAGRAFKGSQRQLQDYVNSHPDTLSDAILRQLPARVRELGARIRWVSPTARDGYREYRDAAFLERVGLGGFAADLADFWPTRGPSWDALGVISDAFGKMKPGVILVEAKSHTAEIYGNGCQASPESLFKIEEAISHARSWCGVSTGENWLGQLYQSANRIAHLYFLYERLHTPVWLVNLYFTDDPIGPADRSIWEHEVARVKTQLGLIKPVPNMIEVYLPALDDAGDEEESGESSGDSSARQARSHMSGPFGGAFALWAKRWIDLAEFDGPYLTEPAQRIKDVLELWDVPIPGSWERGVDDQLLKARYRRGDADSPHAGEHSIEHEILNNLEAVRCLEGNLVDGINALPLARDEAGQRRGNVEGDIFLLVEKAGIYHLVVCEAKFSANTCWYAAIESLRQLKLLHLSTAARQLFHRRVTHLSLPAEIPIIGLVVAPEQYYSEPGKKRNVLPHTIRLLDEFTAKTGIEAHLAVWDTHLKVIRTFRPPAR